MTPPTLEHVTANTAHVRTSPRVEVAPRVMRTLRPLVLYAAAHGGPVPLNGSGDPWTFEAEPQGPGALRLAVVSPDRLPVAVLGVGTGEGPDVAALWADVAALGAPDPAGLRRPPAPWLLASIMPEAVRWPDCLEWLTDASRCLAWAWIEASGGGTPNA